MEQPSANFTVQHANTTDLSAAGDGGGNAGAYGDSNNSDDDLSDSTSCSTTLLASDHDHLGRSQGRYPVGLWHMLTSRIKDAIQRLVDSSSLNKDNDSNGSSASGARRQPTDGRHEWTRPPGAVTALAIPLREMLSSSWINALLVLVPVGIWLGLTDWSPTGTFIANSLAIVPLSALLTDATEKIARDAGDTVGALLNISLGNLVELILFVALRNNQLRIVQQSILGSILVNLLLILGSALLACGITSDESTFNTAETQLLSCLLFVSVFVFLMPTAFDYTYDHSDGAHGDIVKLSRLSAIMVLLIYVIYFVHELKTRRKQSFALAQEEFSIESQPEMMSERPPPASGDGSSYSLAQRTIRFADEDMEEGSPDFSAIKPPTIELGDLEANGSAAASIDINLDEDNNRGRISHDRSHSHSRTLSGHSASRTLGGHGRSVSLSSTRGGGGIDVSRESSAVASERRQLMRSGLTNLLRDNRSNAAETLALERFRAGRTTADRIASLLMLAMTSGLMSINAEFLVSTIDEVTHQGHLSESVIGLIILPIVGNIAEYVTVVSVAIRGKLDLAIAVAVGSSIQIALCVTPLTVIAGWILHKGLALNFNYFEMATLLGSALMVNLLIMSDGTSTLRTSGLKGALLCACYVIITMGAWLSPG